MPAGKLFDVKRPSDEEGHFDSFDKQLDNIKRFGPSYLALQTFDAKAE
jgi:hypothetical protein